MPSPFHDHAVDLVESLLMSLLARTARRLRSNGGGKIATELERVYKGRSGSVELQAIDGHLPVLRKSKSGKVEKLRKDTARRKKDTLSRHPDSSFYHPAQPHLPTTVVEVAFSQSRRKLWRLAQSYIHHAHVQCVIALELPYRKRSDKSIGSSAAISVWRPRSVECQPIDLRSGGANVMSRASLDLYATDFLPRSVIPAGAGFCPTAAAMEIPLAPLAWSLSIAKSRMTTFEVLQKCPRTDFAMEIALLNHVRAPATRRGQVKKPEADWTSLSWWTS